MTDLTRRKTLRSLASWAGLGLAPALAGCAPRVPDSSPELDEAPQLPAWDPGYGPVRDSGYNLPAIPAEYTQGVNKRALGRYMGFQDPGTIEVDIHAKFLYWVMEDGFALRYPIGVGRLGRSIRSDTVIRRKEKWPGWTPTANMLRTEPEVYGPFAKGIPGGLRSPLGARALYLYQGNRDTHFRIHGTNDKTSIGNSGSAGCIRMFFQDIIDLYERVPLGTPVVMRSFEDSVLIEEEYVGRGDELPPKMVDPENIYGADAVAADRPPEFEEGEEAATGPSLVIPESLGGAPASE